MIRTEMDSMPTELDDISRKIMQLEIEEAALKNEDDKLSQGASCRSSQKELAENARQVQRDEGQVGRRKERHRPACRSCGEEIEQLGRRDRSRRAERRIRKGRPSCNTAICPSCKKQLEAEEEGRRSRQKESSLLRDKVTEEEIAEDRRALDGHPRLPPDGGRAREAAPPRGYAPQARHRAGRGRATSSPKPSCAAAPASRTRTVRSARSCSSARRASARPSLPRRWPRRSLTTRRTWCVSI